ncbi:MAG TPA: DUF2242 domain-containing protein [Variovorax sp.]|nr:DUF2242 domain-containing protein [Variovorax sp.]
MFARPNLFVLIFAASAVLVLAGCGSSPKRVSYDPEAFGSTDAHTRTFEASEAQTCEAARRALLSQGYLVTAANGELVTGKKSFQPAAEVHVELEFRVVCANDQGGRRKVKNAPSRSIAFVSALQDRYSLKKVNNSASVGVGVIGSVSLPYSSSDDSLVKVASQTVTDERFYERFFAIVERYLVVDVPEEAPPAVASPVTTRSLVAQPLPQVETTQAVAPVPSTMTAPPSPSTVAEAPAAKPVEPLGEPASMPAKADTKAN